MQDQVRQIVSIYCLCDDFLRAWGHTDAPQAKMTTAQVMTVALVAVTLFDGNHEKSRCFLSEQGYIHKMLSKGNFSRRLHQVPEEVWQAFFALLAQVHQQLNPSREYAVDSMPVPACDNIRIRRCRLYRVRQTGGAFRGYCASKRRYFYGLKVHLVITTAGLPVQVALTPGSVADVTAFQRLPSVLAEGSRIFADSGYLDDTEEALQAEAAGIELVAQRRSNSRRQLPPWVSYICQCERKRIETVFSQIARTLGRGLHAVTARGFELKVFLTVLAYTLTAAT